MMHGLPRFEYYVFLLQTAALIALALRLLHLQLQSVYSYFFAYLVVAAVQSVASLFLAFEGPVYLRVFVFTEALIVCCYALVVLELYSLLFRDLAGIATTARTFIKGAIAASIVASVLLLTLEHAPRDLLDTFYVFARTIISSLLLFVLLITAFLSYYPVPLNRNFLFYSIGYAVYFLTVASALLLRNMWGAALDRPVSLTCLTVSTGCLILWIFALNRQGETKSVIFSRDWSDADEQRLLRQLQDINTALLRSPRK